jgi:hypothetical protein
VRCGRCSLAIICFAGASGCSYASDRLRDAADVFTLTIGAGLGVQPRIGPLTTGAMLNAELGGLRGGCFEEYRFDVNGGFLFATGFQIWPVPCDAADRRGKAWPWMFTQTAWWPYELEGPKGGGFPIPACYFTRRRPPNSSSTCARLEGLFGTARPVAGRAPGSWA